jgi:imidazolonepropionase
VSSDLVIENIGALLTMHGDGLGLVQGAVVVIEGGVVTFAGPAAEAPPAPAGAAVLNAQGNAALPGLIDCHTHLVFAGSRAEEFRLRSKGASYAEIMQAGGGIVSTMSAVRRASLDDLVALGLPRVRASLERGVTTLEVKSGYGLALEHELKSLRAARRLGEESAVEVVATFLGAHAVPPEHERATYVDLVVEEMLPAVVTEGLAVACDIFVEGGAFTVDDGRRVLGRAKELGLQVRVHAEQLSRSGGAQLAAELGCLSAGHLEHASPEDIAALAKAGVVAEVLATAQVFLGMHQRIPGRQLVDAGVPVAVGTDFNPGSANSTNLHLAAGLAVTMCGLSVDEALLGITKNAARALGRDDIGTLVIGKRGDVCVLDTPLPWELVYDWSENHVATVVAAGEIVLQADANRHFR